MKQLFTGLLLALTLTGHGQTGWGGSTPHAGYSKDTLRIRNLERENERMAGQISFLQLQMDSLIYNLRRRLQIPLEPFLKPGVDRSVVHWLPAGELGIPELDSVRMNEFIDSLGRGKDTGTLKNFPR